MACLPKVGRDEAFRVRPTGRWKASGPLGKGGTMDSATILGPHENTAVGLQTENHKNTVSRESHVT